MLHATLLCNKIKHKDTPDEGQNHLKHTLHSCAILSVSWIPPPKPPKPDTNRRARKQTKRASKPCMHTQAVLIGRQTWLNELELPLCPRGPVTWETEPRQTGQRVAGARCGRSYYTGGEHPILLHPQRLKCHARWTDATSSSWENVMSSSDVALCPSEYKKSEGYERSLQVIALFRQRQAALIKMFLLLFTHSLLSGCAQWRTTRLWMVFQNIMYNIKCLAMWCIQDFLQVRT